MSRTARASALALTVAAVAVQSAEARIPVETPVRSRVIAGPAAVTFSYLTSDVVVRRGEGLDFQNLDQVFHTVTADEEVDGVPLFDTDAPGAGAVAEVERVEDLPPGQYRFHCFFHSTLRGTLTVVDDPALSTTTGRTA